MPKPVVFIANDNHSNKNSIQYLITSKSFDVDSHDSYQNLLNNHLSDNTKEKLHPSPLANIYPRKRIYNEIDTANTSSLIWISGSAGSGKTTLAKNYLMSRGIPCLWYRMDKEYCDLNRFFHYLAVAANNASLLHSLPTLTPKYKKDIRTFSRLFFNHLYQHLQPPYALVFDNYERIPQDSIIHSILLEAQQTLPEGINLYISSRQPTPPVFARLRASQHFLGIDNDILRLDKEEANQIAQIHSKRPLTLSQLDDLYSLSDGWMTGLILLTNTKILPDKISVTEASRKILFDYFSEEVWPNIRPLTQHILQQLSVLPYIDKACTEKLTKIDDADKTLSKLANEYLFTYQHEQEIGTYHFHPLFREFLIEQAHQNLSSNEIADLKRQVTNILEEENQFEAAFNITISYKAFDDAARITCQQASILLQQGHSKTLLSWLNKLPLNLFKEHPWLLYWKAAGMILHTPLDSRAPLERAYALFKQQGDVTGATLSCCLIINTFQVLWDDFHKMDPWIERLEYLSEQLSEKTFQEIDAQITSAMLAGYVFRRTGHPNQSIWEARAETLIHKTSDPFLRVVLAQNLFFQKTGTDSLAKISLLLDKIRPALTSQSEKSLCNIWLYASEACYQRRCAEIDNAIEFANKALKLANDTGIHILDPFIHYHHSLANLVAGRIDTARKNLASVQPLIIPGQLISEMSYHHVIGLIAWHESDLNKAYEFTHQAVELSRQAGISYLYVSQLTILAVISFERGNTAEATQLLAQAKEIAHSDKLSSAIFETELLDAYFMLQQGRRKNALQLLTRTLDTGNKNGWIYCTWWRPSIIRQLCVTAIEANIQTDYIFLIIRKYKLTPTSQFTTLEQWPWPIRIYTLGGLRIEIEGKPLRFGSKPPAKPLELLKTLIALGGKNVKASKLADRLWPDTEGDDALSSFKTTLRRLRKLLQHENILSLHEGKLSLNHDYCWIDSHAILQHAHTCSMAVSIKNPQQSFNEIIRLYAGPFLEEEDNISAIPLREQLRNSFLFAIDQTGASLESSQKWRQAINCYESGLKVENLTEVFYQRIIFCYQQLDLPAEALRVYERCRTILEQEFGIHPSSKTKRLSQRKKILIGCY
jgi:ATP/maltotriose-dependent transcriptional regulator MalT/DNA-binding SARP family transcriptional activator